MLTLVSIVGEPGVYGMSLKKLIMGAAAASALAMAASSASAATVIHVGTFTPTGYFFLTSGTPISPSITANFGATISGKSKAFDYIFDFTIPQNGTGSGSLSTSFSNLTNKLTISKLLINGQQFTVPSTGSGQGIAVSGIPILSGVLNQIEVEGTTSAKNVAATFSGTATFAAAVPEPASWSLMIGGLALVGGMMRRRRAATAIA